MFATFAIFILAPLSCSNEQPFPRSKIDDGWWRRSSLA
jgi:hypothetical protein